MGARGALKIPQHLRAVPSSTRTLADRVAQKAPDKPEGLPEVVSAAWDVLVPQLDEAGLLAGCDGPTLELALRHYVTARKAGDELLGLASVGEVDRHNNRLAKHPAAQVFRDNSMAFLEYAKQLGISFVARARVNMGKEEPSSGRDNPFVAPRI